jgi:hypothetical protein
MALAWNLRASSTGAAWRPTRMALLTAALLMVLGLGACTGVGSRSDPPSSSSTQTYLLTLTGTAHSGSNALTRFAQTQLYLP